MAKSNGILKQRRATWLKGVLAKTEEERQDSRWKKLMRRMSNIDRKYLRTHRSAMHIGRNDPCPCGNVYNHNDKPVKFKHCCWHKIHNQQKHEVTQLEV